MGMLAKIQTVMIFAILTTATLYIIVGNYVAEKSHLREQVISSNSPPRQRSQRPSESTERTFISGVEATETHGNVSSKEAENICQSILSYGGVRVDSNIEKECIAYVLEYPSAWRFFFDKMKLYVAWHNLTHHIIQEQLKLGSNLKSVLGGVRTLSYKCNVWPRCTGYGSQMEKTSAGFVLAMLTKRFLTVEWSSNFNGSDKWVEVFTPNVLNWNLDPPLSSELLEPKLCANCTYASRYEVGHYAYSTQYRHVYYHKVFVPSLFCEDSNQLQSDMEPQHMAYFCKEAKRNKFIERTKIILFINGIICRLMYRFSNIVVDRGEKKLRGMGFLHSSFVAVHIRTALEESTRTRKKYLQRGRYQDDITSWKAFIDCGKKAASNHTINKPLLLISDSSDCINWVSNRYSSSIVIYSNSSFWHCAEHSGAEESERNIDKILDTISDLYLISKATVVVKGTSQFSKIGLYLGSISNSNVVRCDLGLEGLLQKRMKAFNNNAPRHKN